jgi:hypothetical protein
LTNGIFSVGSISNQAEFFSLFPPVHSSLSNSLCSPLSLREYPHLQASHEDQRETVEEEEGEDGGARQAKGASDAGGSCFSGKRRNSLPPPPSLSLSLSCLSPRAFQDSLRSYFFYKWQNLFLFFMFILPQLHVFTT